MGIFARSTPPPPPRQYQAYREQVRQDFDTCCAYCLLPEIVLGGPGHFDLDHFKPKSIFSELQHDFYNLFYSCKACNGAKANVWPSAELIEKGYRFVNPCADDFGDHFSDSHDGTRAAVSRPGEYTEARLRLNNKNLVYIRQLLHSIAKARKVPHVDWRVPNRSAIEGILASAGEGSANQRFTTRKSSCGNPSIPTAHLTARRGPFPVCYPSPRLTGTL